ncbi:MAG: hypothetical protein B0W54_22865 [Cellvibrio sp. 79]|nr:MAG: hypothetical protein B0W54_22865 [Cellvibrio sp. 79]
MKILHILVLIVLVSCSSQNLKLVSSEDARILSNLVGEWDYSTGPENCRENGFIGFKQSGKYTRSSENCQIADDSFGNYYYGWYVAEGFICFVRTKEHLEQIKYLGFVRDYCTWKVVEYSPTKFLIHEHWWSVHEGSHEYSVINLVKSKEL